MSTPASSSCGDDTSNTFSCSQYGLKKGGCPLPCQPPHPPTHLIARLPRPPGKTRGRHLRAGGQRGSTRRVGTRARAPALAPGGAGCDVQPGCPSLRPQAPRPVLPCRAAAAPSPRHAAAMPCCCAHIQGGRQCIPSRLQCRKTAGTFRNPCRQLSWSPAAGCAQTAGRGAGRRREEGAVVHKLPLGR